MPRPYQIKAPIVVEALELTPLTVHKAAVWTGGVEIEEIDPEDRSKRFVALNIPTNRPDMPVVRVSEGDYIIKDPHGRFSKVSKEDFREYLEPVEGGSDG